MDKFIGVAVVVVILALLALWFVRGWMRRRGRQADFPALAEVPATLGEPVLTDDVFYVATTRADAPTDRIAVRGLAFRARAVVTVVPEGVVLAIAGQADSFVPRAALRGVGRATWTIDRVVGKDGLVFLRWALGEHELDTYLRSTDPDALVTALETLTPTRKDVA